MATKTTTKINEQLVEEVLNDFKRLFGYDLLGDKNLTINLFEGDKTKCFYNSCEDALYIDINLPEELLKPTILHELVHKFQSDTKSVPGRILDILTENFGDLSSQSILTLTREVEAYAVQKIVYPESAKNFSDPDRLAIGSLLAFIGSPEFFSLVAPVLVDEIHYTIHDFFNRVQFKF